MHRLDLFALAGPGQKDRVDPGLLIRLDALLRLADAPTTQFAPSNLDQRAYCVFLVKVNSGDTLWAQYGGPNQPGLSHRIACAKAQTAASYMVSTFGALSR